MAMHKTSEKIKSEVFWKVFRSLLTTDSLLTLYVFICLPENPPGAHVAAESAPDADGLTGPGWEIWELEDEADLKEEKVGLWIPYIFLGILGIQSTKCWYVQAIHMVFRIFSSEFIRGEVKFIKLHHVMMAVARSVRPASAARKEMPLEEWSLHAQNW